MRYLIFLTHNVFILNKVFENSTLYLQSIRKPVSLNANTLVLITVTVKKEEKKRKKNKHCFIIKPPLVNMLLLFQKPDNNLVININAKYLASILCF